MSINRVTDVSNDIHCPIITFKRWPSWL